LKKNTNYLFSNTSAKALGNSATVNNMTLVHWQLMGGLRYIWFGTARRGLDGAVARPGPPRCTKCNSPSINHRIVVGLWAFNVPFNGPIKGLNLLVLLLFKQKFLACNPTHRP